MHKLLICNLHPHFRAECQENINGYPRARYKKFATESEAKEFVQENALTCPVVDRREATKKDEDNGAAPASRECQDPLFCFWKLN